jgi:hypothetical protein
MKQYIITSIILLFTITIFGQGLQLATMTEVGQINRTNPAKFADKRFYIGFSPFIGIGTNTAGSDVFQVDGGFLPGTIDLESLEDENFLAARVRANFDIGFKVKKWAFSINTSTVFNNQTNFNKEFVGFITEGNAPYIGETINLDPQFNLSLHQEFGLGVSREILGFLNVGIRAKYLVGLADIRTTKGELSLTTGEEYYELLLEGNYQFQVAGLPLVQTAEAFSELPIDSFFNEKLVDPFGNLTGNTGFGFDLGATAEFGDRLQVGLSILDLGSITWEQDATQYDIEGSFEFDGIDAAGFIIGNGSESILDSLNLDNIVDFSGKSETYSTALNPKLYATARLRFGKKLYLNAVLRNEFTENGVRTGFGVGLQKNFGKMLSAGAMYSIRNGSFTNVGANLSLKLGPAQVFVVSDNILPLFQQWQAANTNVRLGLNVTLNDKKKE